MRQTRRIATKIKDYVKDNRPYSNLVKFETIGDYDYGITELYTKLDIINKHFPFTKVEGYYDASDGLELTFDTNMRITGKFDTEPFIVYLSINEKRYDIDIHPYDEMGGLDAKELDKTISAIKTEENTISIVITQEGYSVASFSIDKSRIEDARIYIVSGTQIEGKLLGVTSMGRGSYVEKSIS